MNPFSDQISSSDLECLVLDVRLRRHRVICALAEQKIVATPDQLGILADVDESLRRAVGQLEVAAQHARRLSESPSEVQEET